MPAAAASPLPAGWVLFGAAAAAVGFLTGRKLLSGAPAPAAPWAVAAASAAKGFGAPKTSPKPKKEASRKEEQPCPCSSGAVYADCCQPYHLLRRVPATPEALLRARYSAFAHKEQKFIRSTTDASHLRANNLTEKQYRDNVTLSCNNLLYEGMAVLAQEPGGTEDEHWITFRFWFKFVAEFKGKQNGVARRSVETGDRQTQTERSLFRRVGGRWLFVNSPAETINGDSFDLGDVSLTQTNIFLKAKDAAAAAGQRAAELLPKRDVRLDAPPPAS